MNNMKKMLKSNKFIYCMIFISLIVLCYLFPFSHDDWAWGSHIGIERLQTYFEGYNGRWVGNFVVLALTRSNLLKTIIMASCLTGIIYLINHIIKSDKKVTIFLSYFLLLATPYLIFRQAVVWTSGFSNYAVSIFFVLIYINLNKNILEKENLPMSNIWIPLFLLLGFITTLFVEHITLYTIFLSIIVIVYTFIKLRKIYGTQIAYMIGSILGTILMFSNSAYSSIASGSDTYRSFGFSNFITSSLRSYFDIIYKELAFNNHMLNIILAFLVCIILFKVLKQPKEKKSLNLLGTLILFIIVGFTMYSNITNFMQVDLLLKYTRYFNGLFVIIFCIAILLFVIFFIKKEAIKERMLFILVSIVIMTVPLFVVNPIGSRCFFPIYILFVLFTCDLLNYILDDKERESIENFVITIILCASGVFYVYLIGIYGYIYKINIERLKYLKENNSMEIYLPKLPYEQYLWYGDPANDEFMKRFKYFYKVKEEKQITFINLDEWEGRK